VESGVGVPNAQQPLAPSVQLASPPVTHAVCPELHAFVQHAPALHAPLVQVDEADSYTQFSKSAEHVASVEVFVHFAPTALQTGSVVHWQEADPTAPVQA
jgi:hypothetical protein